MTEDGILGFGTIRGAVQGYNKLGEKTTTLPAQVHLGLILKIDGKLIPHDPHQEKHLKKIMQVPLYHRLLPQTKEYWDEQETQQNGEYQLEVPLLENTFYVVYARREQLDSHSRRLSWYSHSMNHAELVNRDLYSVDKEDGYTDNEEIQNDRARLEVPILHEEWQPTEGEEASVPHEDIWPDGQYPGGLVEPDEEDYQ